MMRNSYWLVSGFIYGASALGVLFGIPSTDRSATAAPPLSIEHLLDEKLPEAPKDKDKILADNSSCYVCHGNYEVEPMALIHAKEDVGCADCHGQSHEHRNDEDNITPPDKMFAGSGIERNCKECHETHDAPAEKVIARWQERCPAKSDPDELLCTDCHGTHRLTFRTVWWNKKTGELVVRKDGQRTKADKDLTTAPVGGS